MFVHLSLQSANKKTGPIPVSTTSSETCPPSCAFYNAGCYAKLGHVAMHWRRVDEGRGGSWDAFVGQVSTLPDNAYGNLWRHNQAGDLPGNGETLDTTRLAELVDANAQAQMRGFTYTHKPLRTKRERDAIRKANQRGFTVNLSGNNPTHADALADLQIAPVVTVLPDTISGNVDLYTPAGRRIVVCPATYRDDTTCASCQLCQRVDRKVIVGFPAHGQSHAKASTVASAT